jgi:hypothetical protein
MDIKCQCGVVYDQNKWIYRGSFLSDSNNHIKLWAECPECHTVSDIIYEPISIKPVTTYSDLKISPSSGTA